MQTAQEEANEILETSHAGAHRLTEEQLERRVRETPFGLLTIAPGLKIDQNRFPAIWSGHLDGKARPSPPSCPQLAALTGREGR